MRQIKFRAWTGTTMEYDVVVGRFGAFYVNPGANGDGLDPKDDASLTPFNTKYSDITPIMQFTGLHDRNGKEIFEGDIVSSPHFKDAAGRHHTLRHVCEWSDRYHSWFLRNIEDQTSDKSDGSIQLFVATRNTDLEVIGNQYETPSLIQGETE